MLRPAQAEVETTPYILRGKDAPQYRWRILNPLSNWPGKGCDVVLPEGGIDLFRFFHKKFPVAERVQVRGAVTTRDKGYDWHVIAALLADHGTHRRCAKR